MSALFDFPSLLVVILLFICTTTFLRSLYPNIFTSSAASAAQADTNSITPIAKVKQHSGLLGIAWKASRVGERVSQYVALALVIMAMQILFFKN